MSDQQLVSTAKQQKAITLASAMITASGRPWSIQEALDLVRDIDFAMHPAPGFGTYQQWEQTKDETLKKVRS